MTDVSDDFNRANGGLGTNWTTVTGANALNISSNAVVATVNNAENAAFWNANSFQNDQNVTFTLGTPLRVFQAGLLRLQSGAYSGYAGDVNNVGAGGLSSIYRVDAGSYNLLAIGSAGSAQWAAGDLFKFEIVGSTLTVYRNGVSVLTTTDSAYASGSPGIRIFNTGDSIDNFTGGPIVAAATQRPSVGRGLISSPFVSPRRLVS